MRPVRLTLVGPGVEAVAYRVEGVVTRNPREAADQAAQHLVRLGLGLGLEFEVRVRVRVRVRG